MTPADDAAALREASEGFFLAAEHGRSDVIKALADHSDGRIDLARIVEPSTGRTPLHVAVAHHKTDALRVLLAAGFPPHLESTVVLKNGGGSVKRTAYALAVEAKAHDLVFVFHQFAIQQVAMDSAQGVAQLLAAGVPIDVTDGVSTANTLLHWAVTCRALAVCRFLLESDHLGGAALVNQANAEGATPLHIACRDGKLDFVKLLLAHGADPRCSGTGGFCKDKTPADIVTSTEIRALLTSHEERLLAAKLKQELGDSEIEGADQVTDSGEALEGRGDEIAISTLRRKHALLLEEKDLLIRQLKATIETLVVEAQEIKKLGEERTVLDYIRKLREEKEVIRRQLEDAEDHIRIQQQQIQELKRQIRSVVPKEEATQQPEITRQHEHTEKSQESELFSAEEASTGSPPVPSFKHPSLQIETNAPRSQRSRKSTPPRSDSGRWNDVWSVLLGNGLDVDDVDVDGEVIMTV